MLIPPLQPGQYYLYELVLTGLDMDRIHKCLPELLKCAKVNDCKLTIGDEPFIWQPDEPRPTTIYEGVCE